ncbi:PTS sugar transporter [Saccharopolyspora hordei]|uniref:Fructose-specific phosphotransferase system IIC component n=1 Tax=Saccharopolyspora hordei TaxID=1838 RepID=A0A853AKJ2_9PSEU|nr:PTS sugar transporter [Saccharopolyspora hordei]NYI83579.1 fructose-specific phosphotransferase system IIC component [Saccharopolyspora hordei]
MTRSGGSATKRVAILGSSGGNLHSHGGHDPAGLLADIARQLEAAGITLAAVQFVAAESSMDHASDDTAAALWTLGSGTPERAITGTLAEVNEAARAHDERVAELVRSGEVDGLVLVSADPDDTNSRAVAAAAERGAPAAGTGGTSLAAAQALGVDLVAASGTTGTTSATRAVSYVAGLARHWGLKYRPVIGSATTQAAGGSPWRRISVRGTMVGSIPAFIALALVLALSRVPGLDGLEPVFETLLDGLPVVVAAVAARRVSGLDEVGLVAGAVAGILSAQGGVLGGLVGGVLAGVLASTLLSWTLARRFPATTANIVSGGLAGLLGGLVVHLALAPLTSAIGEGVKTGVEALVAWNPLLAGAVAGLVMWPAIIGGVYHAVILPLVLVEMGEKGHSFFGAIDMVGLVMVSLGIALANAVLPRSSGERALAASGAAVNVGFGTFVEAAYPFLFADKRVFAGALLSAAAGGALVGWTGSEATAYLPAFLPPFLATNKLGMALAMVTACACAFAVTALVNLHHRRAQRA